MILSKIPLWDLEKNEKRNTCTVGIIVTIVSLGVDMGQLVSILVIFYFLFLKLGRRCCFLKVTITTCVKFFPIDQQIVSRLNAVLEVEHKE